MLTAHSLAELAALPDVHRPSVVTIGNFDGVHTGHQAVIAEVRRRARERHARSVVVTFDPHPSHVLHPHGDPRRSALLTPLPRKLELLAQTGIDLVLVLPFTEILRAMTAEQFAAEVLRDALHTTEIHEGETFRFGHRAEADVDSLRQFGQRLGFAVEAYRPVLRRGEAVSSSRIRSLLRAGNLRTARALLGRSFSLDSTPAQGRGYGTRYAVPTINLATPAALLPAHGVYITTLRIGTGVQSVTFQGVSNAGNRPTFGADSYAIETHLFNFQPVDLTEETPLRLTFLHRLRDERRFSNPDELRLQIGFDVRRAQRFFQLCSSLQESLGTATDMFERAVRVR